jgi:thiol-disulfide isomerase/thioredoxin
MLRRLATAIVNRPWSYGILRMMGVLLCLWAPAGLLAQGVDSAGKVVDPLANAKGRPVVLIFVRTDCPITHRYAPEITRIANKYAAKAEFWLVYPSRRDTAQLIAKDKQQFEHKLPALRDPDQMLVRKAKAEITPEAAVFDSKGALVYHGRIDDWYVAFGRSKAKATTHELDDAVQATLDGRDVDNPETKAVGCYLSDLR